jgi:hypothetical protein
MFRPCPIGVVVLLAATPASAQFACKRQGEVLPIPTVEARTRANSAALQALADHLVDMGGGDNVWGAQFQLQVAAQKSPDPAVRFLLLEQAIGLAERRGNVAAALSAIGALAHNFAIDERASSLALFQRLRDGSPTTRVTAALGALEMAERAAATGEANDMLRYHDAALRCALHGDDLAVYEYARDRIAWLHDCQAAFATLAGASPTEAEAGAAGQALARLLAANAGAAPCRAELAALLPAWPTDLPDDFDNLPLDALATLAGSAPNEMVRTCLRRFAISRLADGWDELDDGARRQRSAAIVATLAQLPHTRGVHRLTFRNPGDEATLVRNNGDWSVRDGLLVGATTGTHNFATHRLCFGAVRSVLVRGGIRSDAGLNFRMHVGDFSLLLNWEVAPENHLWLGGERNAKGPPALVAGRENAILFVQAPGDRVHVCIDDTPWWTVPGRLQGTVTVYPALGSTIFVREILVDGDPIGAAAGPIGNPK